MRDMKSNFDVKRSLAPATRTTSANGTGVDLEGCQMALAVLDVGTVTDGTHTPTLEESDASGSGYTTVAAADMIGTWAAAASNVIQRVSYIGKKQYIRVVVTVAGGPSTGAAIAGSIIRGHSRKGPL